MLLSVTKDMYFNNTSKTTELTQKYPLNSFIVLLFFRNSPNKALGMLFIFICIKMGHAHFSSNKMHFLSVYEAYCDVFLPEKSTKKSGIKVCMHSFQLGKEAHLKNP